MPHAPGAVEKAVQGEHPPPTVSRRHWRRTPPRASGFDSSLAAPRGSDRRDGHVPDRPSGRRARETLTARSGRLDPCPISPARPPPVRRGSPRCRWGTPGARALGFGKRIGGAPAESVMTEIQQRTAEQLFRTLGELKGGAMKFGQALVGARGGAARGGGRPLPRAADQAPGLRSADADPDRARRSWPATSARTGSEQLVWLDGGPTAAASIGQVHKGRWHDGRDVAVKVQYPGAGDALRSDLRQLSRLARTDRPARPRASTSSR